MDKNEFWQIIDTARKAAGSWQDMYIPLLEALSMMEPEDIKSLLQLAPKGAVLPANILPP